MLSMEHLLAEARSNALPFVKKRAILREYLQIIILHSIYQHKFGKLLFFMGGTAMRYFYQLPRFSEDLAFNTADLSYAQFEDISETASRAISKEGFSVSVAYERRGNLFTAKLLFEDVIEKYGITDQRGMSLMVKIEVNRPEWELITESKVLSMYGYNFTAVLMSQGNLLSEKLFALFHRKRGRDIYDTLFMLKREFPFNENVLRANQVKLPIKETLLSYLKAMDQKELKRLAAQLKPFLFKEGEIELILKAPLYGELFLKKYK
ncbi:nucleotidyl transferase AbiEii/AbiGii toxin family protein [Candidatus Omnitrophota bacterium]